jgi:hypothetical protein
VDVLKLLYRAHSDTEELNVADQPDSPVDRDIVKQRAERAWRLLESWRVIPGVDLRTAIVDPNACSIDHDGAPTEPVVKGPVDEAALVAWVTQARSLAQAADRLMVCDREIGRVLAYAPQDTDGTWPARPVRNLIESLQNQDIESALSTEVRNRRGVHVRGDDGAAERGLRDKYLAMAAQVQRDCPRTAAIIREVADDYDAEARAEDRAGRHREFAT